MAIVTREAIEAGDKKGGSEEPWQKVKFDRQIAVIAKVNGASVFLTDDDSQSKFARSIGLGRQAFMGFTNPPYGRSF